MAVANKDVGSLIVNSETRKSLRMIFTNTVQTHTFFRAWLEILTELVAQDKRQADSGTKPLSPSSCLRISALGLLKSILQEMEGKLEHANDALIRWFEDKHQDLEIVAHIKETFKSSLDPVRPGGVGLV